MKVIAEIDTAVRNDTTVTEAAGAIRHNEHFSSLIGGRRVS